MLALSLGLRLPRRVPTPLPNTRWLASSLALPGEITFTRAGDGGVFNSAGNFTTASTDVARFDYNPATLALRGWLLEESRSNLIPQNNNFVDASWTKAGLTLTPSIDGPDDLASATRCIPTTVSELHRVYLTLPVENSQYYWLTGFVRGVGAQPPVITFNSADTRFGAGSSHAWLDLASGVVTNPGTLAQAFARPVKNGYYWFAYGARCIASGSAGFDIYAQQGATSPITATWAGDGTSGYDLSRVQVEAGEFPSSPIDTSGSAVTRPAETAIISGANFGALFDPTAFAALIDVDMAGFTESGALLSFADGTANNRVQARLLANGSNNFRVVSSGSGIADTNTALPGNPTRRRMVLTGRAGDVRMFSNGVACGSVGVLPAGLNQLRIMGGVSSADASGWVRELAFWKNRSLTAAQAQQLSIAV